MANYDNINTREQRKVAFFSFFKLMFFLTFGAFVANLLGTLLALPWFNYDLMFLGKVLADPTSYSDRSFGFLVLQGITSLFAFVLVPAFYLHVFEHKKIDDLTTPFYKWQNYTLTFLIVLIAMPVTSVIAEWNATIHFPAFLSGFENWSREHEVAATKLTGFITQIDTIPHLVLGFVVIGVFAGLGEEFVFRGLFQNLFYNMFQNKHIAVLLGAILFSAIHMQFFGFVPRMLLGMLFGYLYVWSGDLYVPIFAHFLNNSVTLLAVYLGRKNVIDFQIEEVSSPVSIYGALPALLIVGALLYLFFKQNLAEDAS